MSTLTLARQRAVREQPVSYLYNNLCGVGQEQLLYCSESTLGQVSSATSELLKLRQAALPIRHLHAASFIDDVTRTTHCAVVLTTATVTELLIDNEVVATVAHGTDGGGAAVGEGSCAVVCPARPVSARAESTEPVLFYLRLVAGTTAGIVSFAEYSCRCDALSGGTVGNAEGCGALSLLGSAQAHDGRGVTALCVAASEVDGGDDGKDVFCAVSADEAGYVVFWDAHCGVVALLPAQHPGASCVTALQYVVDGSLVAIAYGCGVVEVVRPTCGSVTPVVRFCAHARWVTAMTYNAAAHLLATVAEDGLLLIWSITALLKSPSSRDSNKTRDGLSVQLVAKADLHDAMPTGVAFSPDGTLVSAVTYNTATLYTFTAR